MPTPRHEALSRDREAAGTAPPQTLEEYDDYIVVNGVKIEKPFVEKPVDSDDHNIHIYYPMRAGPRGTRTERARSPTSRRRRARDGLARSAASLARRDAIAR